MFIHKQEAHIFFSLRHPRQESHTALHPQLLWWIAAEHPGDKRLLDVGCGNGRLTLAVAPLAAEVIGVDRDSRALAEARCRAQATGCTNVHFREGDVETTPYATLVEGCSIDMVVANLCMSPAIIAHAYAVLPPGGCLIFAALHTAQWQETGRISRFACDVNELYTLLETTGWQCEALELDTEVVHFRGVADLEAYFAASSLRQCWQQDGRWQRLVHHIATGGERFTNRSHVLVKARKR